MVQSSHVLGANARRFLRGQYGESVRVGHGGRQMLAHNRDNADLERRDARGEDEARVVAVHHDHASNGPRREAPRGLPGNLRFALFVLELDVEHFAKVLSKIVRGGPLNRSSRSGNVGFDRRRAKATGKLFLSTASKSS